MERQLEFRQSFLEMDQQQARIGLISKAHHEIVAVAHDHDSSARIASSPLMAPAVKRVVHKDVGEKWATSRTLRRSLNRLAPSLPLHHAGSKPSTNKPQNSSVGNP